MAMLDGLGVRSAGLAGYSMGGRLGLRVVLDFPERFPVFVGVSTTAGLEEGRAERLAADRLLAERLRCCDAEGFETFLREWWGLPVFESPNRTDEGLQEFLASRLRNDPRLLAECLEVLSPGILPPLWERLPEYPGRALLVAGACDAKYARLAERMAGAFQFGTSEILPDCGHRILEEDPEGLARVFSRFAGAANFGIGRTSRAD
jgi:2-succinyl-6-hydroxy-2,4-cyclohexadiene-1-carboxylate synthase